METEHDGMKSNQHLRVPPPGPAHPARVAKLFYALFLAMYLTTLRGNLLVIILIRLDSHLHMLCICFLATCPSLTSASLP